MPEITHRCPPDGEWEMPCCGLTPFEAPRTDRMTLDPAFVTCPGRTSLGRERLLPDEARYAALLTKLMADIADELTERAGLLLPDEVRISWLPPAVWDAAVDSSLPPGTAYINGYLVKFDVPEDGC